MKRPLMSRRNFFIHDKLWDRLAAIAEEHGINVSEMLRRAVVEFIEREEKKKEA